MASYLHVQNLYKDQRILLFKEIYALEKIHGDSTYLTWKDGVLTYSPGGTSYNRFVGLFNEQDLTEGFTKLGHVNVVVFGEAYGGSCQKMSAIYGKQLRFIAFEVQIDDNWLDVPNAEDVTKKLGLDFVHYVKIPATIAAVNAERDADSVQAVRNGMGPGHRREGVVLRPPIEVTLNNGERLVIKHKRDEFMETASPREVDPAKQLVLADAEAIALEWVTDMRLQHVMDKLSAEKPECGRYFDLTRTGDVITAMIEDVLREGAGEIVESKDVRRAIGSRAAKLYKHVCQLMAKMDEDDALGVKDDKR